MKVAFGFKKLLNKGKRGQIQEKWKFDSKSSLLAPSIVADLDNSGKKHILFGTNDGKIYALDKEANVKWMFNAQEQVDDVELMFFDVETAHSIQSSPNIYDINGDGKKEIVFGSEMGTVYALSFEGELIWKFKAGGSVRGGVIIGDVNEDRKPEIIFGSGDGHIYILNNEGQLIEKYEMGSNIESTPNIIGEKIIFGTNDGHIYCIKHTGEELWKYKTEGKITAQPSIGKIFGDEKNYVIIGSLDQHMYAFDEQGELIWKYKTDGAIYSKAALADINNDKKLEIIFGSCDNNVYAISCTGEKIWSYETDFWIVAPVIVDDIDKDGELEIIAGSYDHNIYILDAKGNYMLDYVPGLSSVLQQTGSYSDVVTTEPGKIVGKKIWQYQADGVVVGCAFIDDEKNIVVNTRPGKINNLQHQER
ncbi:MAG: PQQ-binding-like beta-propeller repeat protein [Nanoarchaeota archaeon]|nr:PQQ-binding-like beta-propeller repeat protein [Nanoarchaeota archaeon]MBU1854612.1 PQQ-binding-like beta-propeller repeat protein [Nanoarchaeota archaeon]